MKKCIRAVIFDYGLTIGCEYYFNRNAPQLPDLRRLVEGLAFDDKEFNYLWSIGEKSLDDIVEHIVCTQGVPGDIVRATLEDGCRKLKENVEVVELARRLKCQGVWTCMVTVNFDVFSSVIVPSHGYERLFCAIVNSSDFGTIDKTVLWPEAFKNYKGTIDYSECLLIEDSLTQVAKFRELGGSAIHYHQGIDLQKALERYDLE